MLEQHSYGVFNRLSVNMIVYIYGNARIQRRAPPAQGQQSAAWIPDPSLAALAEPGRGVIYIFGFCYQAGPHPLPAVNTFAALLLPRLFS